MGEALPGRHFLGSAEIQRCVKSVANQIIGASPKPQVLVPVLSGAYLFAGDLLCALAALGLDLELCPVQVKRDSTHGTPMMYSAHGTHLRASLEGKSVLVADTVLDSGVTLRYVLKHIWHNAYAAHVSAACLIRRVPRDNLPSGFDCLVGLEAATEDYFYGYGMDRNGAYRGLSSIYAESPSPTVPESLLVSQDSNRAGP